MHSAQVTITMMLRFTILAVMLNTRQKINKVYREVFQYIYCASIGSYIVLSFLPVHICMQLAVLASCTRFTVDSLQSQRKE